MVESGAICRRVSFVVWWYSSCVVGVAEARTGSMEIYIKPAVLGADEGVREDGEGRSCAAECEGAAVMLIVCLALRCCSSLADAFWETGNAICDDGSPQCAPGSLAILRYRGMRVINLV